MFVSILVFLCHHRILEAAVRILFNISHSWFTVAGLILKTLYRIISPFFLNSEVTFQGLPTCRLLFTGVSCPIFHNAVQVIQYLPLELNIHTSVVLLRFSKVSQLGEYCSLDLVTQTSVVNLLFLRAFELGD